MDKEKKFLGARIEPEIMEIVDMSEIYQWFI